MKVDIIMPAYNPSNHVIQALESCQNQSYRDIRITVIDDCSTKDWSDIKNKFPNVNFITTPNNFGPGGARNYGANNSSGDLISFLDDDDIMHRDKIYNSVQKFKSSPAAGMVCGNYKILVNERLRPPFYSRPIDINHGKLMKQNFVASGSVTMRRKVFEELGGFNQKYWIAEDYDLWLRCSEKYPIEYIHQVLYYYRIIPGGTSLTQREDIQKKHLSNLEEIKAASKERMSHEDTH